MDSSDTSRDQAKQQSPSAGNGLLYIISLNHFINDGSANLVSSLLPAMILAFGFTKFEVGILVAVGYLVNMIFQPIIGRYSERSDAGKLLELGISILAVSMVMFAVSSTFTEMLISIIVLRFGSSFYHPVGVSLVSHSYTGEKMDSSMGFQSAFGNLGIVFAFALSAPAYLVLGWRGPFLIYFALEVATVAITLLAMTRKRRSYENGPIENQVLDVETPITRRRGFANRLGLPSFFILTAFVSGGTFAVFTNFGNILLFQSRFSLSDSNYIMAVWVVSGFAGALVSGHLTNLLTRERLMPLSFLVSAIVTFPFAIFPGNLLVALASLVINGFALAITFTTVYSELSHYLFRINSIRKGSSYGLLFTAQTVGSSVMGLLGGYIAQVLELRTDFLIAGVLLLGSTAISVIWMEQSRKGIS
jgi:MFS transporter, FSR family, fosmidomycin resistance protein